MVVVIGRGNEIRYMPDPILPFRSSPPGGKVDSWQVDYGASKNFLEAGLSQSSDDGSKSDSTFHYVLLSAICVQKPLLEFQKAKLKLEKEIKQSGAR